MADEDAIINFNADFNEAMDALLMFTQAIQEQMANATEQVEEETSTMGMAISVAIGNLISSAITATVDAAMGAIRGLKDQVVDFVASAAEAETVQKQLEIAVRNAGQGFGFTAGQLAAAATALQDVSIFGDEAIKNAQRMLIQFRLVGETFKDAQQIAVDMASALGQDVAQAASLVGRALASPERATLMLRRAGVVLTEQQREMIKEFMKVNDLAGAQGVLIQELERRFAGAGKEMQNTAAGGWAALQEVIGDIKEELGSAFLPLIKEILPILRELALAAKDWAAALAETFASTTASEWAQTFKDAIADLVAFIITAIEEILSKVATVLLKLAEMKEAAGFFGLVGGAPHADDGSIASGAELAAMNAQADLVNLTQTGSFEDRLARSRRTWRERLQRPAARPTAADELSAGPIDPSEMFAGQDNDGKFQLNNFITQMKDGVAKAFEFAGPKIGKFIMENRINPEDQALIEDLKKKRDGLEQEKFTSGFEDAASTFRRIQTARASQEDVPKQQLTALEKQILQAAEAFEQREIANKNLIELLKLAKKPKAAVAG